MEKEKKTVPKWDALDREVKTLYLALLWEAGYSENAIATFFSTTKGTIVGHRRRAEISSTTERPAAQSAVDADVFWELVDLHTTREEETKKILESAPALALPPKPKSSEPTCKWATGATSNRKVIECGKPAVPGHNLCEEHLAKVRQLGKIRIK